MLYESLFYVNYVHGFMFRMPMKESFKYAKNCFIGVRRRSSGQKKCVNIGKTLVQGCLTDSKEMMATES